MKFELPITIYQEKDCVKKHGEELSAFGTHAFIITGHQSSKKNGSLQDVCDALKEKDIAYTIFDEIEENPSVETCLKATQIGLEQKVDFCIGIGGGSPMDAAKAIALLLGNQTVDADLLYSGETNAKDALPVVCVPTTAGTGSEATPYAILTLHDQHTKKSINHRIYPKISLCDPNYLTFLPYTVLKNTAIDTLAHLIESYLNANATDYSRLFSEYGLKLWGAFRDNLTDMSLTDDDFAAMMKASTIAGMAISHTGTSIPHGLSYPLTYEMKLSHGAACGLFLPGYLYFCIRNEAMKSKATSEVMTEKDTEHIFSLLGVKNLEEFAILLFTLLGDIPVSEELWQTTVTLMMNNPVKLKNSPYPISQQDLESFI